jgi:signal transduction histidine kinase
MFSSIRVRLTSWYLLTFGSLLIAFSTYIYSSLAADLRRRFDASILRTTQAIANQFSRFAEHDNVIEGAEEAIEGLREGRETAAIFREGQLLAASGEDVTAAVASAKIPNALGEIKEPIFVTEEVMKKRLVMVPFRVDGTNYVVAELEPLDKLEGEIWHMRRIILFGLPAALILTAAGGFLLAKKSLLPVVTISEHAEQISAKNLNERLKITNPEDELGRLASVFNALLSRLDISFRVMREFMADASHELRTPLTIIQGEAEVSLSNSGTVSDYRQSLSIIRDQAKRSARIVSDMLALARADAGEQNWRMEELYLNDLVEESCQGAQSLAALKGIRFTYEAGEDVMFKGNEDTGIGIPPESIERVFDRFYRVEDSRTRASGGSGLGLSIVKLAAEAHRGSVNLVSEANNGSTFTVSLPL